jgi:RNA polymerase sigma-70 factor (ECF subfamily)
MQDYSKLKDQELIEYFRQGGSDSDRAFAEIYKRYAKHLNAFCCFKLSDQHQRIEIFQQTWVKFNDALIKSVTIENVKAYLITIARNLIYDQYKLSIRNSILHYLSDNSDFEDFASPINYMENLENRQLIDIIKTEIDKLDDKYKEAFTLNKINALSYTEISEITHESIDCIKKRITRATNQLRTALKEYIIEINES